jgi:RHS repeat-associated protein
LPFGPIQSLEYGNGLSLRRTFDRDYGITAQQIPEIIESRYAYDPVDNIREWDDLLDSDQDQRFSYDLLNRLIRAKRGEHNGISYTYDALGNRLSTATWTASSLISTTTTLPVYDEAGQPIREYLYLDGQPMALLSAGQLVYLYTDHLGAVIKGTDDSGSVVWSTKRDPFGMRRITVEQVEMPLGFPGQYYDQETNNYYNYFRDYDPATGRYLQSDPIGLDGGLNTYAYVDGNPLNSIDVYGLMSRRPHPTYGILKCKSKNLTCEATAASEILGNCTNSGLGQAHSMACRAAWNDWATDCFAGIVPDCDDPDDIHACIP